MSDVCAEILEKAASDNVLHATLGYWLQVNGKKIFNRYEAAQFIAIKEVPPKNVFAFKKSESLESFMAENPNAEYKERGYEQVVYML